MILTGLSGAENTAQRKHSRCEHIQSIRTQILATIWTYQVLISPSLAETKPMNIDPMLLGAAVIFFILGWASGRRSQMKRILHFVGGLNFEGKSINKDFETGMHTGTNMIRDVIYSALKTRRYITGINVHVSGKAYSEGNPDVSYKDNSKD